MYSTVIKSPALKDSDIQDLTETVFQGVAFSFQIHVWKEQKKNNWRF